MKKSFTTLRRGFPDLKADGHIVAAILTIVPSDRADRGEALLLVRSLLAGGYIRFLLEDQTCDGSKNSPWLRDVSNEIQSYGAQLYHAMSENGLVVFRMLGLESFFSELPFTSRKDLIERWRAGRP